MQERVKVFTFVSGHGETVVEPPHEDHINQWLTTVRGRLVRVSQSESEKASCKAGACLGSGSLLLVGVHCRGRSGTCRSA